MALRSALLVVVALGVSSQVASAECSKTSAGAQFATGTGNGDPKAKSPAHKRLAAEKAAYLEALKNLKTCLGPDGDKIAGWTISEVRYFDSDPVVEIDVAVLAAGQQKIAVIGSGLPDVSNATGGVANVRVKTERAAKLNAQANAKAALDKAFASGDAEGSAKQSFKGMLGACTATKTSYWDDQSVTVTLECGKDAPKEAAKPTPAPALAQHDKK